LGLGVREEEADRADDPEHEDAEEVDGRHHGLIELLVTC
jgi:hypothetical protein